MTDATPYDAIYLSPHLDDAVLSCGGQIHRFVKAGQRILIVTFTTGVPEDLSPAAEGLHRRWGLTADEVLTSRRREDEEACAILGVDHLHIPELDALYRRDAKTGEAFYHSFEALFQTPAPADEAHLEVLVEHLEALPPAPRICSPLGVGRHVDHLFLRRAAQQVYGGRLEYYEDYPYVQRFLALWKTLGLSFGWTSRVWPLTEEDVEAKCDAICCFTSQISALFNSEKRMEDRVWAYAARVGGERLWWRPEG
jgi:LmbE family N-acetylglucosaminyl deacetylase